MFWVFAINEVSEREKFTRQRANHYAALVRNNKLKAFEVPRLLDADVTSHMAKVRAKPMHEFAMPSSAEQYADVLRAAVGFRDISIKARILAPSKDGARPSQQWVSLAELAELADVDVGEQVRLRGVLDGSAFAPREAPRPKSTMETAGRGEVSR